MYPLSKLFLIDFLMRSLKKHVGVGILTFISFEREEKEKKKTRRQEKDRYQYRFDVNDHRWTTKCDKWIIYSLIFTRRREKKIFTGNTM